MSYSMHLSEAKHGMSTKQRYRKNNRKVTNLRKDTLGLSFSSSSLSSSSSSKIDSLSPVSIPFLTMSEVLTEISFSLQLRGVLLNIVRTLDIPTIQTDDNRHAYMHTYSSSAQDSQYPTYEDDADDLNHGYVMDCDELFAISMDHLIIKKPPQSLLFQFSIYHMQLDDMREEYRFPVVLRPKLGGYNSLFLSSKEERAKVLDEPVGLPVLELFVEVGTNDEEQHIIKSSQLTLQELDIHIDVEFCLTLIRFVGDFLTQSGLKEVQVSSSRRNHSLRRMGLDVCEKQLVISPHYLVKDEGRAQGKGNVYIEYLKVSELILNLEILVGERVLNVDFSKMDRSLEMGMAYFGTRIFSLLTSLIGSIAHVHPSLHFNEAKIVQFFGPPSAIMSVMTKTYLNQAARQSYKVFGSLEVLGDPLSMVNEIGDGVVQFISNSSERGNAKTLAQHLVGSTFGTASRLTGGLASVMRGVVGQSDHSNLSTSHISATSHHNMNDRHDNNILKHKHGFSTISKQETTQTKQERGLETHFLEAPSRFFRSVETGFSGMIREPQRGLEERGGVGAMTGVVKGVAGAIVSPFVGTLDLLSSVTGGLEAIVRQGLQRQLGRRRDRRRCMNILSESDLDKPIYLLINLHREDEREEEDEEHMF